MGMFDNANPSPQVKEDGFKFTMNIAKSFTTEATDVSPSKMVIRGVASNTKKDKQGERFSYEGLECIKAAIEKGVVDEDGDWTPVPLRSGHRNEWEDILGWVTKAEIDEDENLWIEAELDEDNDKSRTLFRKISKGNANGSKAKLGLSVKGKVTKWTMHYDPEWREQKPHLHNLLIKEISVTGQPVNPSPYALEIAKSLTAQENEEIMPEVSEVATDVIATPNTRQEEETANAVDQPNTNPDAVAAQEGDAQVVADAADETIVREQGDVIATPNTRSESQNAEAEEVVTTDPEVNANSVESVAATLASIAQAVEELKGQVETLAAQREAQKAMTEEVVTEPVILEADAPIENLDERITLAVSKALEALGLQSISSIANDLTVVKSSLAELSDQPVDRSISVSKAKDDQDQNDPFVRMSQLKEKGHDSLTAAFMAAHSKR